MLSTAALLVGFSVFFGFVLKPTYLSYKLNSCLKHVDSNYRTTESNSCDENKPRQFNECLKDAQSQIYCSDKKNHEIINPFGGGILSGYSYCKTPVPDNSNGYWNNNGEYQKLVSGCEAKISVINCDFSQIPVDHEIKPVKSARNECFSLY